jgi:hypothetical protein
MQYLRRGSGGSKVEEDSAMAQTKRASRGKRSSKAVSALGIAGMSLAASTGGSQAEMPVAAAGPALGSAADMLWQNAAPFRIPMLDEEEISDVSLATFYLFDKDNLGTSQTGIQQTAFRGGCGCGHGCGGGCRGCGGVRGCAVGGCRGCAVGGCRGCGVGFRGCGWGGCGGCGGCGGVIWGWGGGCCLSWGACALC